MSYPGGGGGAGDRERSKGCQCQCLCGNDDDGDGERHSGRSLESHGDQYQWSGGDKPTTTTTKRGTGCAGGHRIVGCLSHRWFIIGLPKVPDTKFRGARLRANGPKGNSGRPKVSIIPPEAAVGSSSRIGAAPVACEPSSPNVSCIGRVNLKKKDARKWAEAEGKLLHVMRFFAGNRTGDDPRPVHAPKRLPSVRHGCEDRERDSKICETNKIGASVLGWEEEESLASEESLVSEESGVAHSCSSLLKKASINDEPLPVPPAEPKPKPTPNSENNLWKRRPVAPIKPLDLVSPRGSEFPKPSTV